MMPDGLVVEVDSREVEQALGYASSEILTVVRNALNDTARTFQKAEKAHILKAFDVKKRAYILNSVYFPAANKATKTKPWAEVEINPARDILAKFETGGRKVALRGSRYVAYPGRAIKTTGGHVKRAFRLETFKPFREVSTIRGRRTVLVGEKGSRFVTLRKGRAAGLPALVGQRLKRSRPQVLWLFVPDVKLPPDLKFETIGVRIGNEALPIHLVRAMTRAFQRQGLL